MKYGKTAADHRFRARTALKGHWGTAVLAAFLAALLGGINDFFSFTTSTDSSNSADPSSFTSTLDPQSAEIYLPFLRAVFAIVTVILIIRFAIAIASLILGGVITAGYGRFNLNLIDGAPAEIGTVFSYFNHFGNLFLAELLQFIYIFLWTMLFVIPGIVAAFSYAMVPYILAENPTLPASKALKRSKDLMRGNRWRLFCLLLSFIGWEILAILSLGIGFFWVVPYEQASFAAFYRYLTARQPQQQPQAPAAPTRSYDYGPNFR